jgi:hypothetical protein
VTLTGMGDFPNDGTREERGASLYDGLEQIKAIPLQAWTGP